MVHRFCSLSFDGRLNLSDALQPGEHHLLMTRKSPCPQHWWPKTLLQPLPLLVLWRFLTRISIPAQYPLRYCLYTNWTWSHLDCWRFCQVTLISTSNMVVSEVDTSSSITAFWIVFLTLVCTTIMLGAIGAFAWKVRTLRQHETADSTLTPRATNLAEQQI